MSVSRVRVRLQGKLLTLPLILTLTLFLHLEPTNPNPLIQLHRISVPSQCNLLFVFLNILRVRVTCLTASLALDCKVNY